MSLAATVLYEDSCVKLDQFGPHLFVMACLRDLVNGAHHDVNRLLDPRPMNGDSKVVQALTADFDDIARDGRCVFALLDSDRIRRHLRLEGAATDDDVRCELLKECPDPTRAQVFFLDRNLEALLLKLRDCNLPLDGDFEVLVRAKNINTRDLALKKASTQNMKFVRDCILRQFPGLASLIRRLADLVGPRVSRDSSTDVS